LDQAETELTTATSVRNRRAKPPAEISSDRRPRPFELALTSSAASALTLTIILSTGKCGRHRAETASLSGTTRPNPATEPGEKIYFSEFYLKTSGTWRSAA